MNRISFLNRGYAFKGLLAVYHVTVIVIIYLSDTCLYKHTYKANI